MKRSPKLSCTSRWVLWSFVSLSIAFGLLGWLFRIRESGRREFWSVAQLHNYGGCYTLPNYQLSTVRSESDPEHYVLKTSGHGDPNPREYEWLFGPLAYRIHTHVLVCEKAFSLDELTAHLRNYRKLEHVFYRTETLTEAEVEQLRLDLPNTTILSYDYLE